MLDTESLWLFCHIAIDERQSRTGISGGRRTKRKNYPADDKNEMKIKRKHMFQKPV